MADSALEWCSVDRLKEHLSFAKDSRGSFVNVEQDTKIADCIQGAVSWCASHTSLPLIKRVKQYRFLSDDRPSNLTSPLLVRNVVSFGGVENGYLVPDNMLGTDWTRFDGQTNYRLPFRWLPKDNIRSILKDWYIYPGFDYANDTNQWPPMGNGVVLDIIEDVPATSNMSTPTAESGTEIPIFGDNTAITNAVILMARDLYDGGGIMERKTTAEKILESFVMPVI